jgi:hypothetical protein
MAVNGAARSEFVYYDDDGETLDYRKGKFRKRAIAFDPDAKLLSFSREFDDASQLVVRWR